jgi:predicted O-methyltransferase YrrM
MTFNVQRLRRVVRAIERARTDKRLTFFVVNNILSRCLRKYLAPSLHQLAADGGLDMFTDPAFVLEKIDPELFSSGVLRDLEHEFSEIWASINDWFVEHSAPYHQSWSVGQNTGFLVHALIRMKRPETIVETGVANGVTTTIILNAIGLNGFGKLVSFDVRDDVGELTALLPDLSSWQYIRLSASDAQANLRTSLEALPSIDVFIHDSNHAYSWQEFEYETARRFMHEGSLLMSDDIDSSFAFIDFLRKYGFQVRASLIDRTKVSGLIVVE